MTAVFRTLRNNAQMFPRLTILVANIYALVGLMIAIPVAVTSGSVVRGIVVAAVSLLSVAAIDIIIYMVIASKPDLLYRCQRAADALVRYPATQKSEPEPEEEDDQPLDDFNGDYDEESEQPQDEQEESPRKVGDCVVQEGIGKTCIKGTQDCIMFHAAPPQE